MTSLKTIRRNGLAVVLATVASIAVGGAVQAAERVRVGDLDLATRAGAATLQARIDVAARRLCPNTGEWGVSSLRECREAVAQEVREGLSSPQRDALVAARAQPMRVATASPR